MLNQVAIMGRMATEPEMRQTTTGKMTTSFRVCVDRDRRNANGEREGDFFTCVAWEKVAEKICTHFPKGAQIALTGRLQSRDFQDKTGARRQVVEINVANVYFCGAKPRAQEPTAASNDTFAPVEDDGDLPF